MKAQVIPGYTPYATREQALPAWVEARRQAVVDQKAKIAQLEAELEVEKEFLESLIQQHERAANVLQRETTPTDEE